MAGGRGRDWRLGKTRAFDAEQQAAFVAALERGATVAEAAREAGVAVATAYYRRGRDPAFAAAWAGAAAASSGYPDAEAPAEATHVRHRGGGKLIRMRKRPVEFDRERKQAFLDHFAATCNFEASAKAAGVSIGPVYRHLASDPAFADGFDAAMQIGYTLLEAEALRQQRAAQEAYRIAPDPDAAGQIQSFERVMQLLREYNRGAGKAGRRAPRRGDPRSRWTFDEAMAALEKKLKHFGVEIPDLPESTPTHEQVRAAPQPAAVSGGHGDLLISPIEGEGESGADA